MSTITIGGNEIHTDGSLPAVGAKAPAFSLWSTKMQRVSAEGWAGKTLVLNIFPSIDTSVCAMSVRKFNEMAAGKDGVTVLNISADLPFAHKRFCGAEGLENVDSLSTFESTFAADYGVRMNSGPLVGLLSRAVMVVGADGVVKYTEQVPEIGQEPDYQAALAAI
jgi:thiol peroxidase